jgi:hypothetical protein
MSNAIERAELTEGDLVSPTWGKIKRHLDSRLAHLREQLEQDVSEQKSARIRGQIAEVKLFLGLADDRPIL